MQQVIRINSIKGRADRIGASMKSLCEDAGVHASSVYRWLAGDADPRIGNYERTCERLETALARRERELLEHLRGIHTMAGGCNGDRISG